MKDAALPNYIELSEALKKTALNLHPSQVHGVITGVICGSAQNKPTAWETLMTGGKESANAHRLLQDLYDTSATQLSEFLFEFQLVLPEDSEELPVRAEALTLWCQGFLTGLEYVKVKLVRRESGEATEAINDLIEIAKMNYEDVVESEEDEKAYFELVEYIRMTVILIYQELHESDATGTRPSAPHLH